MRVCIATSTRADWGLLSPLARELKNREGVSVDILATNMHLLESRGNTLAEIRADGFSSVATIPMEGDDSPAGRVRAMAMCMDGCAGAFTELKPDLLVILGDRFEMLAIASAACVMRIPVAHIAGGEVSEGAIDDSIRHAITKLASMHFTATEQYRRNVISMGEEPERVVNTGALGVWNLSRQKLLGLEQLQKDLGFTFTPGKLLVVTYHPATLDNRDSGVLCRELLAALDNFPDYKVIVTYPNNDAGAESIVSEIERYAATPANQNRVLLVKSLGMLRYLSVLQFAAAVVGNSSSGIVEVPSAGIPTVDTGIRQKGRISAPSVIHCGESAADISTAISLALSEEMRAKAAKRVNPYGKDDTVKVMADAICSCRPECLLPKHHSFLSDESLKTPCV